MRRYALIFLAAVVFGGLGAAAPKYSDHAWALLSGGALQGPVYSVNFTGTGVSCTQASGAGTCTIPGVSGTFAEYYKSAACSATPCGTPDYQKNIASVDWASAGAYTLNFTTAAANGVYRAACTCHSGTSALCSVITVGHGAAALSVQTFNAAGAAANEAFQCVVYQ